MGPAIGLCLGTVRQASLGELIDVAGTYLFPTISVPPHIVDLFLASGATFADLRRHLAHAEVRVTVIDALTRDLPGAPSPDEVPPIWRQNWTYGLDDLIRMAQALEAPTVNVTHFLGKPVEPHVMAEAIAALAERAGRHGLRLSLEFMPETSLATVASSARIVQLSGAPNVGLMVDIWHLLRTGGDAGDIRMLPPGFVKGVQLNDRRSDASEPSRGEVSSRSLPGRAMLLSLSSCRPSWTTRRASASKSRSSVPELAALSPAAAGERVALALARWQRTLGDAVRPRSLGSLDA